MNTSKEDIEYQMSRGHGQWKGESEKNSRNTEINEKQLTRKRPKREMNKREQKSLPSPPSTTENFILGYHR
jgi:hypothetical protein